MQKETKILIITRNFPPARGGIETVTWELLRHGTKKRPEKFIVLHYGQRPYVYQGNENWGYHHLPSWSIISTLFFTAVTVPYYAFKYKPDLIIAMQVTLAPGPFIMSFFSMPYCVICHGLELIKSRLLPYNWLRRVLLHRGHKILSNSNFTDSLVSQYGINSAKRFVLPLGADLGRFSPSEKSVTEVFGSNANNQFVCLTVSRLIRRKGVDTCIQAVKLLISKGIRLKYYIGGGGPDEERLKSMVKSLDMEDHIRFLGKVPEDKLADYFSTAHLFLLPSRSTLRPPDVEGFGLVFLEVGACGTPAIGSKSGGIPDAVLHGKTGYLIEPDNAQAMADIILSLINNPVKLRELGANARERVLNSQNWETVARGYFDKMLT